ncbi:MAG: hypothetical protein ACOYLR_12705, partial [Chlorobium sp.]
RCRRKPARRSSATNPISRASLIFSLHRFYRSLQGIRQVGYLFCWFFHIFSIERGVHKKFTIKFDTLDRGIFAGLGSINA